MTLASHTVRRTLDATVERTFDVVVAEDVLPRVLHRWGPIPAVLGTRDLTGPWNTPGSQRTVMLGNGSAVREQLLQWRRPHRFEYRVDRFAGPLGVLADYALGSWLFRATDRGAAFHWTYAFRPRSAATRPALLAFVHTAWARYMNQCADLSVRLAETFGSPRP